MTRDEYLWVLSTLGMSQQDCGRFMGVHEVTGKRWARNGPPPPVAKFLRYMQLRRIKPWTVDRLLAADESVADRYRRKG